MGYSFSILIVTLIFFSSHAESNLQYIESYDDSLVYIGDQQFNTEVANTLIKQRKGMMFRPKMQDNQAMMFIYNQPRKLTFWMKNTLIPLDILFFDHKGKLLEIKENIPPCKTQRCPTYPSKNDNIQYVIEINAKLARKRGIKLGDSLYGCGF